MAKLEAVTVQHEAAKSAKIVRISARVRVAIDAMVFQGLHRRDAAKTAGLAEHSLYVALTKPHVLAYMNTQKGVIRTSAEARTLAKAEALMESAESEAVRMRAIEYLSPPVTKSENIHIHQGVTPGLTLIFGVPDDALTLDAAGIEEKARIIKSLPTPTPHPALAIGPAIGPDKA